MKLFWVISQWWTHVVIHLLKPTECTAPRVSPNVNYGLWVPLTCQGRFISYDKCAPLVGTLMLGEAVHSESRVRREISILPSWFCCGLKTSLKTKFYFKKLVISRLCPGLFSSATLYCLVCPSPMLFTPSTRGY